MYSLRNATAAKVVFYCVTFRTFTSKLCQIQVEQFGKLQMFEEVSQRSARLPFLKLGLMSCASLQKLSSWLTSIRVLGNDLFVFPPPKKSVSN